MCSLKNLLHLNGERQALIESLEECLRLVESGELDSVCWVGVGRELVMRGAGGRGHLPAIIGELRRLEFSLLAGDYAYDEAQGGDDLVH